jgi:DNA-binding transcriptional LysR family regulator
MAASIQQMAVFTRIVATGSLSSAARDLGVSPAIVSRTLAALETRLGVRLLNRTTRRLNLTDEGAKYHEACGRILAEIEEADSAVAARRAEPQGVLRVALHASFAHKHVAPLIPDFTRRYPRIKLALSLSDRTVNVIDEGFDLAIQIAQLEDSSLAARKLAPNRRVVCASPKYLAAHGTPRVPEDLAAHNCIMVMPHGDFSSTWEYRDPRGNPGSVRVTGKLASDSWEVMREWAVSGMGIAIKSTWDVRRHLEDGSLVALCPGYTFGPEVAIYAVYPHRRHLPAKTRVFIDFLADSFGPEPYWDQPLGDQPLRDKPPKPRIRGRAAVATTVGTKASA